MWNGREKENKALNVCEVWVQPFKHIRSENENTSNRSVWKHEKRINFHFKLECYSGAKRLFCVLLIAVLADSTTLHLYKGTPIAKFTRSHNIDNSRRFKRLKVKSDENN